MTSLGWIVISGLLMSAIALVGSVTLVLSSETLGENHPPTRGVLFGARPDVAHQRGARALARQKVPGRMWCGLLCRAVRPGAFTRPLTGVQHRSPRRL